MKFITTVHLLFNMFSVPGALLSVTTALLSARWRISALRLALYSHCHLNKEKCHLYVFFFFSFLVICFSSAAIVTAYETNTHDPSNNNAMLGVHASASAIIQYGKIARKQVLGLTQMSFLNKKKSVVTFIISMYAHVYVACIRQCCTVSLRDW